MQATYESVSETAARASADGASDEEIAAILMSMPRGFIDALKAFR